MIALIAAGVVFFAGSCVVAYHVGALRGMAESDEITQPVLDAYRDAVDHQRDTLATYEELCAVYRLRIEIMETTTTQGEHSHD